MKEKKPRGFAAMNREKHLAGASLGGRVAQAKGTAHSWTREEAKIAGAKGGVESARRRRLGPKKGGGA